MGVRVLPQLLHQFVPAVDRQEGVHGAAAAHRRLGYLGPATPDPPPAHSVEPSPLAGCYGHPDLL
jgi:hypothetical protein